MKNMRPMFLYILYIKMYMIQREFHFLLNTQKTYHLMLIEENPNLYKYKLEN